MTGNSYLIDTKIVIEICDGNKKYADKLRKQKEFFFPVIAVGELFTGINRIANKAKHLKLLTDFLTLTTTINIDITTAKHYGDIIVSLYKKGKPIPTNDVWIAALTIQYNFTVASKDNHFKEIEGLEFEFW